MDNLALFLYKQPQTIFTLQEVSILIPNSSSDSLKVRLFKEVKNGRLIKLRKNIYAKPNYNSLELANKLYTPSYISLETVLIKEGMIFQQYQATYVISYLSRTITIQKKPIIYRKIKDEILHNTAGIVEKDGIMIATPERAFLDTVFLYKDYYIDNLDKLNWDRVTELLPIYKSKILIKRVTEYRKN